MALAGLALLVGVSITVMIGLATPHIAILDTDARQACYAFLVEPGAAR